MCKPIFWGGRFVEAQGFTRSATVPVTNLQLLYHYASKAKITTPHYTQGRSHRGGRGGQGRPGRPGPPQIAAGVVHAERAKLQYGPSAAKFAPILLIFPKFSRGGHPRTPLGLTTSHKVATGLIQAKQHRIGVGLKGIFKLFEHFIRPNEKKISVRPRLTVFRAAD